MGINHFYKIVFLLLICLSKVSTNGSEVKQKLVIALTSQFPPYTVSLEEKTGIDPELISRVLERAGYDTAFIPTTSKRVDSASVEEGIDAVTSWTKNFMPTCYVTKPYRYWLNVLIVPQSSPINSLEDLAGKRLAKFEGAEDYISNFNEAVKDARFVIVSDSSLQAGRMVKADRIDAYIGDYVGYFYALVMQYGEDVANELTSVKHYFNHNKQRICFKDEAARDAFDSTLDQMIDEGIYKSVYDKYSPGISEHHFPNKDR